MSVEATVVLVHGAWADASCWNNVNLALHRLGIPVTAIQIPLTSLADDVAVARRLLGGIAGPIVLVGHSYGGAVITGAAAGIDAVAALVYITGFALDEGESLGSIAAGWPPSPGSSAIAPDEHGYLWIDRDRFHDAVAADASDDQAYLMASVEKPLHMDAFTGLAGPPAWRDVPSWYLVCTDDHMIAPAAQEAMALRAGAKVQRVRASHAAFMAHSPAVVRIIAAARDAVAHPTGPGARPGA